MTPNLEREVTLKTQNTVNDKIQWPKLQLDFTKLYKYSVYVHVTLKSHHMIDAYHHHQRQVLITWRNSIMLPWSSYKYSPVTCYYNFIISITSSTFIQHITICNWLLRSAYNPCIAFIFTQIKWISDPKFWFGCQTLTQELSKSLLFI